MSKMSYAVKIDSHIIALIKRFCVSHGVKQGFFVEKALREQLTREEFTEDLLDFKNLAVEEKSAVVFEEYLKRRSR